MRGAWYIIKSYSHDELVDVIESLPALVRSTECHMPSDASTIELESLNELLVKTLDVLRQQQILDECYICSGRFEEYHMREIVSGGAWRTKCRGCSRSSVS